MPVRNNVRSKGIKITLDKPRTLRFDMNAMAELEERFGSIEAAFESMEKGTIKGVRAFLWAALVHEDETLTEKQVGALIDYTNLDQVSSAIFKAMGEAMPQVQSDEEDLNEVQEKNEETSLAE